MFVRIWKPFPTIFCDTNVPEAVAVLQVVPGIVVVADCTKKTSELTVSAVVDAWAVVAEAAITNLPTVDEPSAAGDEELVIAPDILEVGATISPLVTKVPVELTKNWSLVPA